MHDGGSWERAAGSAPTRLTARGGAPSVGLSAERAAPAAPFSVTLRARYSVRAVVQAVPAVQQIPALRSSEIQGAHLLPTTRRDRTCTTLRREVQRSGRKKRQVRVTRQARGRRPTKAQPALPGPRAGVVPPQPEPVAVLALAASSAPLAQQCPAASPRAPSSSLLLAWALTSEPAPRRPLAAQPCAGR